MGKQWRKAGKVHGEATLATLLYPQGYLHRLWVLLRINKVHSWGCLLITVRSVTAWDRLAAASALQQTMGAPSASPAPGISKVQREGHQPFCPFPVVTQPKPPTPSSSSTQPNTARENGILLAISMSRVFWAQCRKFPAQPQPTCSFLLPQTSLSVTIFASIAAVWWMKFFSISVSNFISAPTYKTLEAIKLYFYPNFL